MLSEFDNIERSVGAEKASDLRKGIAIQRRSGQP